MGSSGHLRLPLIVAALLLVTDFSLAANALVQVPEDVEDSGEGLVAPLPNMPPPLMCGDVECPEKNRMPGFRPADSGPPVEDPGWWFGYWYDLDSNGMDDRLSLIHI